MCSKSILIYWMILRFLYVILRFICQCRQKDKDGLTRKERKTTLHKCIIALSEIRTREIQHSNFPFQLNLMSDSMSWQSRVYELAKSFVRVVGDDDKMLQRKVPHRYVITLTANRSDGVLRRSLPLGSF